MAIKTCERCGGLYATENGEMYAGTPCRYGVPKGGECKRCGGNGRVEMLEHCPACKGTGREYFVAGIIIPDRPPPGVVEALRNFVDAIEEYDRSGVWPDNYTLRKLATEGREALNCGHSSNESSSATAAPPAAKAEHNQKDKNAK